MDYFDWLEQRLLQPLPGIAAHRELVPAIPDAAIRLKGAPPGARQSAVLIPLIDIPGQLPDVMFTLRSDTMRNHSGQISFPGGRCDEGEDATMTAVRELFEETGVAASSIRVLGSMSSIFIPPSNSSVIPIVALIQAQDTYAPSEQEVREIFHVSLAHFANPSTLESHLREISGITLPVPQWHIHQDVPLWGATAMMLNELVHLVREFESTRSI